MKTDAEDAIVSPQTIVAAGDELHRALSALVETKSSVKVFLPGSDLTFAATFFDSGPAGLVLAPEQGIRIQALPPLSLCSLYFTHGVLTCTTLTRLRECQAATATEPARIVLESPDHLVQIQARSSERV